MRIELKHVKQMPGHLDPGILYVSLEFGTAQHLCACGCGSKVRTPLGAAEWQLQETRRGPTLSPSIGNWQKPCRSHYWIWQGDVRWAEDWSEAKVAAGRARDHRRLEALMAGEAGRRRGGFWRRLLRFLGFAE